MTRQQHTLLLFLNSYIERTGIPPSFAEMMTELNLRSKSGIWRILHALEESGHIVRRERHARAIEIVRLPPDLASRELPAIVARKPLLCPHCANPLGSLACIKAATVKITYSATPVHEARQ